MSVEKPSNSPDSLLVSFFSENQLDDQLVLIAGPSGSGKTSLCARLATLAGAADLTVGGILCPAVFEEGKKVGIDQLDISSRERQRLGVRSKDTGYSTVGCWQLDEDVIARGNQIIAGLQDEDIIIIDELGPLELEEGYGYQQALRLLDERRYHTAFVVVRTALLSLARLRWPESHCYALESVAE